MSVGRVLATQQARDAAKQLLALTGSVKDKVGRVLQHGSLLADPTHWGGGIAGQWRTDWGPNTNQLNQAAAKLDELEHRAQQIVEDIFKADDAVDKTRDKAAPKPGLWSQLGSDVENLGKDALHGVENVGVAAVNDLASLGNAAINHPGDVAAAAGGVLLTDISAVGEGGGLALDATGVGAVGGVPLNIVSAAGMATGVGITGAAMANMISHAAGDDHVEPLKSANSDGTSDGTEQPPFDAPTESSGRTAHGEEQMLGRDGGHGVSDEAANDAVSNPVKPPRYVPDKYGGTYRYVGKDATVCLNKDGEVTTAWANTRSGWRNP